MSHQRYDVRLCTEDMYPSIPGKCACGCGKDLPPRKRRWATQECIDKAIGLYLIRKGNTVAIRNALRRRDHGVCARCKADTEAQKRYWQETFRLWLWLAQRHVETEYRAGRLHLWSERMLGGVGCDYARTELKMATGRRDVHGHWWEAHHKVPVAEGGGGCDLDGYETLCLPCHKLETRLLRQRMSKQGRKTALSPFQRLLFER